MSEDKQEYVTDALELMGITEPRKIVTEISGFIPVFEVVLHHYKDYMTALVFGRMWQYCNMSDGVCRASLDRIGKDLEISAVTVMRHAEKLVTDGYLIDTTPDRRNAPHEYLDGRRVEMKSRITAGITESNATVIKSKATVIKSQLIKQDNTKDNKGEPPAPNFASMTVPEAYRVPALRMYRDATGVFPGQPTWEYIHNTITQAKLTREQIAAAFEAWNLAGYNNRNVKGILEWARDGVPNAPKKSQAAQTENRPGRTITT